MAIQFIGSEFTVNDPSANSQLQSSLTALASGRFLATWASAVTGTDFDVRAKMFSADGSPTPVNGSTVDFLINHPSTTEQVEPTVAALPDGRFVVAWRTNGPGTVGLDIRARVFNAGGTPAGDNVFVNTTTADDQFMPSVAGLANGGFVVTWATSDPTVTGDIRGRIFDADGTPADLDGTAGDDPDFLVNTTTPGFQSRPAITGLADGRFVATWSSGGNIGGRIFNADGTAGPEFLVNTSLLGTIQSAITALSDGRFVVTWTRNEPTAGFTNDIRGRVFNADGTAGSDFVINTTRPGAQVESSVAALPDGRFVVAWRSFEAASNSDDIRARVFNANGTGAADFVVNTTTAEPQRDPSVAALGDGSFMVTWSSSIGGQFDIRGQVFRLQPPEITSDGGGATASVSVDENSTAVTTVTAGLGATYSISGGADAARFTIDSTTGALAFTSAPNFEAPTDAGTDNVYDVTVRAVDDSGDADTQALAVTVLNVNEAPTITSDTAVSVVENTTAVTTVTATDPEGQPRTFSITGGDDAARFTIGSSSGALAFLQAPDFEAPADAGADNIYDVTVTVSDGAGGSATQDIAVTVLDGNDPPVFISFGGAATAAVSVAENSSAAADVDGADPDGPSPLQFFIFGGADGAQFIIDGQAGTLVRLGGLDFEQPADANGDNIYEVTVGARDGAGAVATQHLSITVTNVSPETIQGSSNDDVIVVSGDNFVIDAGSGDNQVTTGTGNDQITTGTGSDTVTAGGGNDVVRTGAGGDTIVGGVGNGNDVYDGGADIDTVVFSSAASGIVVDLNQVVRSSQSALGGGSIGGLLTAAGYTVTTRVGFAQGSDIGTDALLAIENVVGGQGNDVILGNTADNILTGGAGRDGIAGGLGKDRFVATVEDGDDGYAGGDGSDTLDLSAIAAAVTVVLNASAFSAQTGRDSLTGIENAIGGSDNDALTGTGAANLLDGRGGDDLIQGLAGNDTIIGGTGNDTMNGGQGDDLFVFAPGFDNDRIEDFDPNPGGGQDHLDISALGIDAQNFVSRVTVTDIGSDVLVSFASSTDTILLLGIPNASSVTANDFLLA